MAVAGRVRLRSSGPFQNFRHCSSLPNLCARWQRSKSSGLCAAHDVASDQEAWGRRGQLSDGGSSELFLRELDARSHQFTAARHDDEIAPVTDQCQAFFSIWNGGAVNLNTFLDLASSAHCPAYALQRHSAFNPQSIHNRV